jgi:hypothetical protein
MSLKLVKKVLQDENPNSFANQSINQKYLFLNNRPLLNEGHLQ